MRTFAIGDIHGCNTALAGLLARVRPEPEDRFVFLGDYIDRGPASREVIESLLGLSKTCSTVFLRGNHEVMILEAREDPLKANLWQSYGGLETVLSYSATFPKNWVPVIPPSHWEFFQRTIRYLETATHIFVHACLDPELEMNEQPDRLLFWEYFDQVRPHKTGKRIVCGHTPQRSGFANDMGFAVCIDTGAAVGGWLTCLDTSSGKYWQANEQGKLREGALQ